MKEIFYVDDLMLMDKTIAVEEFRKHFEWKQAFESIWVKVNLGKSKLMEYRIE